MQRVTPSIYHANVMRRAKSAGPCLERGRVLVEKIRQVETSNYRLLHGVGEQDRRLRSWHAPADMAGSPASDDGCRLPWAP
jgi:hypothetical protein